MDIGKNKVVTLHYKLQVDDAQGEMIEETFGSEPLVFLHGVGQMIPEFENQLEGKASGDDFSFRIDHASAYGEFNPNAIVKLPISTFVVNGKLAKELLEVGRRIPMQDQNGNPLNGTVKEVQKDTVVMDFNHPLAGVDLFFSGKIEDVRQATDEEVAHGHVHGPGGHEH